ELKRRAEADLRTHHTVRQMKQTSGNYTEIELVRSDSAQDEDNRGAESSVKMNSREWDETVQRLAAKFNKPGAAKASAFGVRRHVAAFESADMSAHSKNPATEDYETMPMGKLSALQEDEGRYYATAVVKKSKDRLKLARVEWRKEPLESWRSKAENQMPKVMAAATANYTLPTISDSDAASGCTNDTWTAITNIPSAR